MSFRTEEKLLINNLQLTEFKEFLYEKRASKNFPSRKIQSLYFENFSEDMYKDSIEGIVPRKKIRIRNYPDNENLNLYLEMKVSSVEGRYKTRKIIDRKNFENIKRLGIYDRQYGTCRPLIYVNYIREYFQLNDVRISIDENIYYNLFSGRKLGYDINSIVELKSAANKDKDELLETFPFQRTRFSKYCNGFEKI